MYGDSVAASSSASSPAPTVSTGLEALTSLSSLTAARAVPLKYARRGGAGKKTTITSTDDSHLLDTLTSTTTSTPTPHTASTPSTAPPSSSSVSVPAFTAAAVPTLIDWWVEALGGDDAQSTQSSLTSDSLQCAAACASILHSLALIAPTAVATFIPGLGAHVMGHFPVQDGRVGGTAGDAEVVATLNVHLCHVIAAMVEVEGAAGGEEVKGDGEKGGEGKKGEGRRRREGERAEMLEEWTSALLDFIGRSFYTPSSSSPSSTPTHPPSSSSPMASGRGKKRQRGKGETASLQSTHVSQLLPIVRSLLDRLSSDRRQWLVDGFTAYFFSLHPLSPAKHRCLALIADLLEPPAGAQWMQQPVRHSWVHSLPHYLVQLEGRQPATSHLILRVLHTQVRCYHPQLIDVNHLVPGLLPFYTTTLFTLPVALQLQALPLLYYVGQLPREVVVAWAGRWAEEGVDAAVRQLMVEVVGYHRWGLTLGVYLSFLLSCVSTHRQPYGGETLQPHRYLSVVLQPLRQLCDDGGVVKAVGLAGLTAAQCVVKLLEPQLLRMMGVATDEVSGEEGQLRLNAPSLLLLSQAPLRGGGARAALGGSRHIPADYSAGGGGCPSASLLPALGSHESSSCVGGALHKSL